MHSVEIWSTAACTTVQEVAFEKTCIRRLTVKITQDYRKWCDSIGHVALPIGS